MVILGKMKMLTGNARRTPINPPRPFAY